MKVTLVPILQSLRSIYDVEGVMPRFEAYTSLMTSNPKDVLPLGAFSPMGKKQPSYLNALLDVGAESIAQEAAAEAASRLSSVSDVYRVILVVVDAPQDKNTWTDRYLTDAEWRFENKYDTTSTKTSGDGQSFDRWVTVQLWTDIPVTTTYITQETQAAIYRAAHRRHVGVPERLGEMMAQEERARRFAGIKCCPLDDFSVMILEYYRDCEDYPTCFAAMYGDAAAMRAGYPELGLDLLAGFRLSLEEASGDPWIIEEVLKPRVKIDDH